MNGRQRPSVSLLALYRTLIWTLGMAPLVMTVLWPRRFDEEYQDFMTSLAQIPQWSGAWLGRAASVACCAIGVCVIAGQLATRRSILPRNGLGLWLASLAPVLASVLASRFGTVPEFSAAPLVGAVIFTTAYAMPRVPLEWFVRQVKLVLLVYAYSSLAAAALAPSWAAQSPYGEGWIPGLSFRLHGATPHANTLGPLMALYLILSAHRSARLRGEKVHRAIALVLLVLSQSKSTWAALLVGAVVYWGLVAWPASLRRPAAEGKKIAASRGLLVAAFAAIASAALLLAQPWLALSQSINYLRAYDPVVGRMLLWDVTLQLWRENPWFGYGPSLWGPSMSSQLLSVLRWAPGSAHNQLFQTLGESGLMGVVGLCVYAGALLVSGLRQTARTPLPLTLGVMLLMRGATEAVFKGGPDSPSFFMSFVAYGVLLASGNARPGHRGVPLRGGDRP